MSRARHFLLFCVYLLAQHPADATRRRRLLRITSGWKRSPWIQAIYSVKQSCVHISYAPKQAWQSEYNIVEYTHVSLTASIWKLQDYIIRVCFDERMVGMKTIPAEDMMCRLHVVGSRDRRTKLR